MTDRSSIESRVLWARRVLVAFAIASLLARVTVGDRVQGLSTLVYATPPPLIALLLAGSAAIALWERRRGISLLLALAFGGLTAAWWAANTAHHDSTGQSAARIVSWNVARGVLGDRAIAAALREESPDLIALVEAGDWDDPENRWLPGYRVERRDGLLLAARVPMGEPVRREFGRSLRTLSVPVCLAGREVRVTLIDMPADPFRSRRRGIELLSQMLATQQGEALILGDFNTPLESVWLRPLRSHFVEAFEVAGNGLHATWPNPLPMMALDHAWVSPEIPLAAARLRRTLLSDHAMLVVDLAATERTARTTTSALCAETR